MAQIRKILVPTDFSDNSVAALRCARSLAPAFGAEVLVIHVLLLPLYPFALTTTGIPELEKQFRGGAAKRLAEFVGTETEHGVESRAILKTGDAFLEIIETAREEEIDLIVIATHGHTGIKHLMLGSIAEKVVRTATCPVLAVRKGQHEFVVP